MAVTYEIGIVVNSKSYPTLQAGLKGVGDALDSKRIAETFKKELRVFLNDIATVMEQQHSGSYPGGTSATSLASRSGKGVRSIRKSIRVSGGSNLGKLLGSIGGLERLFIHEFGGTIRAKNGHLAIPLPDALNSRGVPKKQGPRAWSKTKILRSKNGNLVIYQDAGSNRKKLLYVLIGPKSRLKEIRFVDGKSASKPGSGVSPARLGMRKAVNRRISSFADKLSSAIVKEMNKELANA